MPVWGVFADHDLHLDVGRSNTAKVRHLHRDPRVAVHLDDADDVVIVQGVAHFLVPTGDLAILLVETFRAKYPGYLPEAGAWADGSLVRIDPRTVLAWRDMPSATRWRFPGASRGE